MTVTELHVLLVISLTTVWAYISWVLYNFSVDKSSQLESNSDLHYLWAAMVVGTTALETVVYLTYMHICGLYGIMSSVFVSLNIIKWIVVVAYVSEVASTATQTAYILSYFLASPITILIFSVWRITTVNVKYFTGSKKP